jgi:hypothetical protein
MPPRRPSLAAASRLETETRKAAKADERKPVKLSFSIPARTHAQLKMLAAQRYQKIGALVEELINAELVKQKGA